MMDKYRPYWERNGMRRPLIGLTEAVKRYGFQRVSFFPPNYENPNQCPWCGKEVNNKRRRYCSDDCRNKFQQLTVWNRGRGAYSYRILCRDKFTCQDCGEIHNVTNEHGMTIPIDDGQLEVHHILPVCEGGGDEPENLVTLCKDCHKERHRKMRMVKAGEKE